MVPIFRLFYRYSANDISIANALRDYEYMQRLLPIPQFQASRNQIRLEAAFNNESMRFTNESDEYRRLPEGSCLASDNLRDFLKRHLPRTVTYTMAERKRRSREYIAGKPAEDVSPFVDRLARFIVAFLGGSMLVVPMLVMRLPEVTIPKSLSTVSVSVLLFSCALSIFFRANNVETLIATATYAAVLVVFVGVSG